MTPTSAWKFSIPSPIVMGEQTESDRLKIKTISSVIQSPFFLSGKGMFGFTMQDSNNPVESYIADETNFKPTKITNINTTVPHYAIGKTKIIHWRAKDGLSIEGLLTYPAHYEKGKRYPLIVEIHGGPQDVFHQQYLARLSIFPVSVFSSRGYFYSRPNIRGSDGYGWKFAHANYKDWGGNDQRVPPTQAEEFYRALTERKIPVEMILYPNTKHVLSAGKLQYVLDGAKRTINWIEKYS